MKEKKHIHEYVRVNKLDGSADKARYRCAHPTCHHWQYKNFLMGKLTVCAICHKEEFLLDREALRRAKPSCVFCCNSEEAKKTRLRINDLNELFREPELPGAAPEDSEIDFGGGIFFTGKGSTDA